MDVAGVLPQMRHVLRMTKKEVLAKVASENGQRCAQWESDDCHKANPDGELFRKVIILHFSNTTSALCGGALATYAAGLC